MGSCKKTASNDSFDQAIVETASSLSQYVKSSQKRKADEVEDEEGLFSKNLEPRLSRITPRSRAMVRIQIKQLFYQAEFPPARQPVLHNDSNTYY